MSRCPKCQTEYPEHVIVCAADGEILNAEVHRVETPVALGDTVSLQALAVGSTLAVAHEPVVKATPTATLGSRSLIATDSEDKLPPGFTVGEYEIVRHVGSGGMASVYAGVHPVIGKEVAIKVLSRTLSSDRSMVERFVQEARAVNQIRHHNIVDIFALGQLPDGRAYCVMELLTGETLKDRLRSGTPSYEETVSILSQICEGLDAAHKANVVHRDLKPDNIFLVATSRGPAVKILDFGIAKLLDSEAPSSQQTRAGILIGTPEYMSPEQCGGREVDARTDIYLLGVMLYEVFTGRVPFSAKTPIQTINAHVSERPTDPRQYAELPPKLRDLILACLSKEPGDRPQSALEVRDRLFEVVQSLGVDIAQLTLPQRPSAISYTHVAPPVRRKSRAPLAVGLVLVFGAAAAFFAITHLRGDDETAVEPRHTPEPQAVGVGSESKTVALQVISIPPGASVTLDDKPQRLRTPYVYNVPWAKRIAVRVELTGHKPHAESVELVEGELEKLLEVKLVNENSASPPPSARVTGTAATITNLQFSPAVAWVGEKTTVIGTIDFEDPDADVVEIRTELKGRRQQSTPLRVSGAKTGTAAFTLVLSPTTIGPQTIDAWVQDRGDNASNRLSGTIEVLEREESVTSKDEALPDEAVAEPAEAPSK